MGLIAAHCRLVFLVLIREPAYCVPTLLFPTLLYLFFGARFDEPRVANAALAAWSVFAVLGVAFYQFGVGLAQDRQSPWESYVRTLPAGPAPRFVAQTAVAVLFAMAAVAVLWLVAGWIAPLDLRASAWLALAAALAAGAVPFAFFGIALGYLVPAKAAVPVANLIYLPLTFAGGLWLPPWQLPAPVATISPFLPTRHYGELAWAAVAGRAWPTASWLWLIGYAALFAGLAIWAYRRVEGRHYV